LPGAQKHRVRIGLYAFDNLPTSATGLPAATLNPHPKRRARKP
jgi:hypothetical protein